MNNESYNKFIEIQKKNNNTNQQMTSLKNNKLNGNYFISDMKKLSPNNNKNDNLNNIYHNIKFKGKTVKIEEIKNHDSFNEYKHIYKQNNNEQLLLLLNNRKINCNNYYLIKDIPKNNYSNPNKNNNINKENQNFHHNISPIKINLFNNIKPFNSDVKSKPNIFYNLRNQFMSEQKSFKELDKEFINDDNNFPHIPKNDTCIENFENLIIKKNNINIIPIPKKLKTLNNEIRKNLFHENTKQKINKFYSPPRKNIQNIDINIDYSNECTVCQEQNTSFEFNKRTNINLTPKIKYFLNYDDSLMRCKNKMDNKNTNIKGEISRKLNISVKKLKNINSGDFKIFWSGKSKAGKDKNGNIKTNQDAFRVCENINNIKNFNFYILCDGHGKNGHFVSKFIVQNIISKIITDQSLINLKNTEEIYQAIIKNDYQLIKNIFSQIDIHLSLQNDFDTYKSGCTCVLIIQVGSKIICANIGDSRAILVYSYSKNLFNTKIFPLSIDSKPDLPSELIRIKKCGGEVHRNINNKGHYLGPMRIFAKGKDYPGLAMSRSFGDFQCKEIGVICEPSFIEYCLDENCKYLVLGSDGVWDFLENENVAKIGNKYYLKNNPEGFCNEILENASYWWEKEDNVVDDITALIVFFKFFI